MSNEIDRDFLLTADFGPKGYCHMKLPDPNGGWPKQYGIITQAKPLVIRLLDKDSNFELTDIELVFASVDEIIKAGWLVD